MNEQQQLQLFNMIAKYKKCKQTKRKRELRNIIYESLHAQMLRWVGAALTKLKWHSERDNIVSWSWDSFLFCLDSFDHTKKINTVKHFSNYTIYYLRMQRLKIIKENSTKGLSGPQLMHVSEIDMEFLKGALDIKSTDKRHGDIVNHLHDLEQFRGVLDDKYQLIFDDAMLSMAPEKKFCIRRQKEIGIPSVRYREAKKIFKHIIRFFIGTRSIA